MEVITRKVVTVIEYIEITRRPATVVPTAQTRVEPTPPPPSLQPAPPSQPAQPAQQPRKGDIVEYYSKAGRRGEYRVHTIAQEGTRVQLKGYNRKTGFWVDAAQCHYLRRSW